MGSYINNSKSTIKHTIMKHIIILLLLPILLTAQRDTLTTELRVYINIDTLYTGARYKVTTVYYKLASGVTTEIDTSNTSSLIDHIDDIIAQMQDDSIRYNSLTEHFFTLYKEQNTYFQNAKRYLAKLWAIRP